MNPGRELDAIIAEKVMGWVRLVDCKPPPPKDLLHREQWYFDPNNAGRMANPIMYKSFPEYSTDISAAWEVVEKINNENFTLGRMHGLWVCSNTLSDMWGCYHDNPDRYEMMNDGYFYEQAETAPHAICLAALKAIK